MAAPRKATRPAKKAAAKAPAKPVVLTVPITDLVEALNNNLATYDVENVLSDLNLDGSYPVTITVTGSLNPSGMFAPIDDITSQIEYVLTGGSCDDLAGWVHDIDVVTVVR